MGIIKHWGKINLGCHGIPERCLLIYGKRMKICARCLGSTIGHVVAFFLMIFGALPVWYISVVLLIIMFVDRLLQEFFGIISNNTRRLITGLVGGLGVGSLIWSFVLYLIDFFLIKS